MTLWITLAAAAIVLGLVAAWLHYRYWVSRFTLELDYSLVERVETEDGSAIELRRLPAPIDRPSEGPPVLLVHGLAVNHRNNDVREDLSLGRHLGKLGHDVWFLTLRMGRDDLSWSEERRASYERMARYDVPLAVDEVLRRTGAPTLDYVGFSMGGMLIYAAAGRFVAEEKLHKVVVIGSPGSIQPPLAMLSMVARLVPSWIVPTLRLRIASRMFAFASEWVATPIHRWIYNPENVERGVAAHLMVNGFVNIPGKLASELVRWAAQGGVVRCGETPITVSLAAIDRPALFIAGAADRIAPPPSVALAFEAWGGHEKAMRVVGVEQGAAADYGHGDLAIGRFAAEDVFEPVAAFLADPERAALTLT